MEDYFYQPPPKRLPIRLPRRKPKRVVPSYIGESGQVLNMLMNYTRGWDVYDHSGQENHGAFVGNVVWVEVPHGGWAIYTEGDTSHVDLGMIPADTDLTVMYWVYSESTGPEVDVMGNYDGGGWILRRYNDGIQLWPAGSVDTFPVQKWVHICSTWDKSADDVIYYKNGSQVGTGATGGITQSSNTLKLGQRGDDSMYCGVRLKLVKIFRVVKSGNFVNSVFENERILFGV